MKTDLASPSASPAIVVGALAGAILAYATVWDGKTALAMIAALVGMTGIVLLWLLGSRRLVEDSLFVLAIFGLALTFLDNNFGFRQITSFFVLVNGFRVSLSDVVLTLLAVLWWLDRERPRERFCIPMPLWLLLLLSLAWGAFNAAFVARESFFAWSLWWREFKIVLILLFLSHFIQPRHFALMGYALAVGVALQFLAVLDQRFGPYVFTKELLKTEYALQSAAGTLTITRYSGTLGHPNTLANFLLIAIVWLWFMIPNLQRRAIQFFLLAAIALAFWTLVQTGSRGGWLASALALGFGIVAWYKRNGKNVYFAAFVAIFTLAAVFAALWNLSPEFRQRLTLEDREAGFPGPLPASRSQ